MLTEKMYVRCPADKESISDPRVFVCGQIIKVDDFKKTVRVRIYDPLNYLAFFEDLPKGVIELPKAMVQHCSFFLGSTVYVNNKPCKVLSYLKAKDGFFYYYLQNDNTKEVFRLSEKNIVAPFNNGRVDPSAQLRNYEFQNPSWFFGHFVVSKSVNVVNNSIYGFKELAGSKIFLLPHQINSIMRCLQEEPCRYMLADEVGMGKTIEAISVFKIYLQDRSKKNVLIIVPETLKEQWKTELFFKFNIEQGMDKNHNYVDVKSIDELDSSDLISKWDFVIIDEVHRYLGNDTKYSIVHTISKNTKNILLLSATPVQQRREEYLDLLRLLLPSKYDSYSNEQFGELIEKQGSIIQKTVLILDDLSEYEEEIEKQKSKEEDPHDSEDCQDAYEEINDSLSEICEVLDDIKLNQLFDRIDFDSNDLGVYAIKVVLSYICSNYQIESNIIRNRRRLLEISDNSERLLPTRELKSITYELDNERNVYEAVAYEQLGNWIIESVKKDPDSVERDIRPLLNAFFSSPWAFSDELRKARERGLPLPPELITNVKRWESYENNIVNHVTEIIEDPVQYSEYYSTRIVEVLNTVCEELFNQKVVLFTNYGKTFEAYKSALTKLLSQEEVSFFGESLSKDEIELNAYRFQNDRACRIMLCDYTGGEGRNFQCADYIIHIDLPWDANMIEQRIGRLDRLERDPARPVVHSVVIYSRETFEEALFQFWNEGLKIFTQSLSGMEIIMKDVNQEIISAIQQDFKFGLFDRIPKIIELADNMRKAVKKEQSFDAAGLIYRPMYKELARLVDYYSQNENELFANTMRNWASLAGFHGSSNKSGVITYSANSFVPKSAINALLIPPKWNEYINSSQNAFVNRVQDQFNKQKKTKSIERSIKGTFIRKQAIENDYLHFFAPGDAVFDCIVDNAMHSCKGQASAFAFPAAINWTGFVFTCSLSPNISLLLEKGISVYALSPYRNYLMSEQIVVPVSIRNDNDLSDEIIIREFTKLIEAGFKPKNVVHLGKRGKKSGFLKDMISGDSNIEWFRHNYTEENWKDLVNSSTKEASAKALEIIKHRSNIRGAREEMERVLSARAANAEYYGLTNEGIEAIKQTQEAILDTIKRPRLILDSAAFVWMVKANDEK